MGTQGSRRKNLYAVVVCNVCGSKVPVIRVKRKHGVWHQKPTWCVVCKDRTMHTEEWA